MGLLRKKYPVLTVVESSIKVIQKSVIAVLQDFQLIFGRFLARKGNSIIAFSYLCSILL